MVVDNLQSTLFYLMDESVHSDMSYAFIFLLQVLLKLKVHILNECLFSATAPTECPLHSAQACVELKPTVRGPTRTNTPVFCSVLLMLASLYI